MAPHSQCPGQYLKPGRPLPSYTAHRQEPDLPPSPGRHGQREWRVRAESGTRRRVAEWGSTHGGPLPVSRRIHAGLLEKQIGVFEADSRSGHAASRCRRFSRIRLFSRVISSATWTRVRTFSLSALKRRPSLFFVMSVSRRCRFLAEKCRSFAFGISKVINSDSVVSQA